MCSDCQDVLKKELLKVQATVEGIINCLFLLLTKRENMPNLDCLKNLCNIAAELSMTRWPNYF